MLSARGVLSFEIDVQCFALLIIGWNRHSLRGWTSDSPFFAFLSYNKIFHKYHVKQEIYDDSSIRMIAKKNIYR